MCVLAMIGTVITLPYNANENHYMVRIDNQIFSHDEAVTRNVAKLHEQVKAEFARADRKADLDLRSWLANYNRKQDVGQGYEVHVSLNRQDDGNFQGSHKVYVHIVMEAYATEGRRLVSRGNVKFYRLRGTHLPAMHYDA